MTRWYLPRAHAGYLRENEAYARITDGLAETVHGARTVESLGLGERRRERGDADIRAAFEVERYTLRLRTVLYPVIEFAFVLPVAATLLGGGLLYIEGHASLAQVTAATLYVQQLSGPVETLLAWLDELQLGGASLARVLGVGDVPPDRVPDGRTPGGERLTARDVRYAYRDGRDVLHGVGLELRPGSGSRWSGRAAPGSRRWAGCSRGSTAPAPARSRSAASRWWGCRWTTCAGTSRSSRRSSTCSAGRCATTW